MRPPTHEIDSLGEYVDLTDPAWDLERVDDERRRMKSAGEDPDEHPVTRYVSGSSRVSLDATSIVLGETRCAREYFTKGSPTIWRLRRLKRRSYRAVQAIFRQDDRERACEEAVRMGVDSVEGPKAILLVGGRGTDLRDVDLDAIWESDTMLIDRLANAIILHSQPLTSAEGKC